FEDIQPLYVLTANLDEANKILLKEKVLLITGDPGVGKTTLAEVILFEKAKAKYRIHIVNTIREAEDMISVNNKEKQIFYFDDFLGEVYYEIIAGSQKENEVAQFVNRIKNSPNKFLILSTRTVILEQAKSKSEKIKRSKIESGKYEIVLGKYTNFEKAKILYNHLYFQSLKEDLFNAIIEDSFFMYIIKHKNYTPRIIEFITQKERIQSFTKFEYTEFIKKHLTYPEEIWEDSYLNQIEYLDRCLLQTLFTFDKGISESLLRKAFENRLNFEKNINNKQISSEQFESSVRNLLHGFITSSITNIDENLKQFSFVNPSISDFLISYFNKNYSIKKATVQSIKYLEQFSIFNPDKDNFKFEIELQKIVKSNIQNDKYDSIGDYKKYKFIGQKMEILMKFCSEIDTDNSLLELLKDIEYKNIWWIRKELYFVMNQVNVNTKSFDYIEINFLKIMESYIEQIEDEELALSAKKLFKKYGHSFKDFSSNEIYQNKLISLVSKVTIEKEKSLVRFYGEDIENWDDYNTFVYDEIEVIKAKLSKSLLPKNISIDIPHHYGKEELEERILINKKERKKANHREQKAEQLYHDLTNTTIKEDKRIEDLFYRKK
ncbi:nSTAND3 domain-containing NTPase, partial [Myroides marinus]|uniref:nSTAND3 domain-containing NTPase n=1 Tax=Myroides marinus TaxID=703342 RepID=UPI0005798351